jgi:hypothetical protein
MTTTTMMMIIIIIIIIKEKQECENVYLYRCPTTKGQECHAKGSINNNKLNFIYIYIYIYIERERARDTTNVKYNAVVMPILTGTNYIVTKILRKMLCQENFRKFRYDRQLYEEHHI